MSFQAGFAEIDISPTVFPVRTYFSSADTVMDPLFAHAAAFSNGGTTLVFLSLDVVIVEAEYAIEIKRRISEQCEIPSDNIMVCATHNHACPAVVDRPGSEKDDIYLDFMITQALNAALAAVDKMEKCALGIGAGFEEGISFNRRYVKKDGTVVSQPKITLETDDILCHEGVVDPEVGVVCVRNIAGNIVGVLVNFACHAVHHMGSLSAGYPGVLSCELKKSYGPDCVCVFLNGACGNVIHRNFSDPEQMDTKEITGKVLADDVKSLIDRLEFSDQADLAAAETVIKIKYRDIHGLEENIDSLENFNVFSSLIAKGWYKYSLEKLRLMHAVSDHEEAIIQVFRIGDVFFATAPCEYFSENALKIKADNPNARIFVVSLANGWLGYVPHPAAFKRRGGHESTWAIWSKMEESAGDLIADQISTLVKEIST